MTLPTYDDDQRRSSSPFARPGSSFPEPSFVLAKIDSEQGSGVYTWKRRAQDAGKPTFPGPLGGKATAINGKTGIATDTKIIVFPSAGRWWFDDGAPNTSSGSGLSFVDFSHTFTGTEDYEADGANRSMVHVAAVPITGEFFLWGCTVKITTTLVGGTTVNGVLGPPGGLPNLPWKSSYLQIGANDTGTSTGASPIYMNGFPSYTIATGHGDGATFSGVAAGSFINGRGLEAINQIIFNGYKGGIPDSTAASTQRHLWWALEDSSFNHADQIVSGAIKGRIWFFQCPTTPSDL